MYTETDYLTRKALAEDIKKGVTVRVYQPGPFPGQTEGKVTLEGPHFPRPHTWYCQAIIKDGVIVRLLK